MIGWCLLAAAVGAAIATTVSWLACRRVWHGARRLRARSRSKDHLAELGQLAAGLAHEIKNPLSTINMNLKLLSEDVAASTAPDRDRWLRRLQGVQAEAGRLREILDDFLRYAGRYELDLRPVDLRATIGELTDFFAPQADAARIVLRTSLPAEPVCARIDENLFKQAMLNLMINAAQAMDSGGELLIRLCRQRDQAVAEVIDTGPGIASEDVQKIFQVYYSTRKGGTGLGLPTTRRIVQEHGGELELQSEPGRGTRFILRLPACQPDGGQPPVGEADAPADADRPPSPARGPA